MALAEILKALQAEGDGEIARITVERDATVAHIAQSAREQAKQAEAAAATARDEALAYDADVMRHRADLHVERRLQEEREAVFQEILRLANDRLSRYRQDPDYSATVEVLLGECRSFLGSMATVLADPRDAELLTLPSMGLGSVQLEFTLESWGGVVAHDGNGVFVRNTLEERLESAEAELRRQIGELVPGLAGHTDAKGAS